MEPGIVDQLLAAHGVLDVATGNGAGGAVVAFEPGAYLFREGEPADRVFLLRRGRVALELFVPDRGALIVDTVPEGGVLGVSWLFPPYRWQFDACALEPVEAAVLDAATVRAACERDPHLGYQLLKLFAEVVMRRLQSTRLRLIDLYGHGGGDAGGD